MNHQIAIKIYVDSHLMKRVLRGKFLLVDIELYRFADFEIYIFWI